MRIWDVSWELLEDEKDLDSWSKVDTYSIAAISIEEAIKKCQKKASEEYDGRSVRVYEVKLAVEVDVE